jgi:GNAT superfamily N-acetyltransferase
MTIRPATADDAAAIAEMFLSGAREAWGLAPDELPAEMEPPAINGGELIVEDEDGLAGFAIIKDCEIDLLFTHPRAWGRGAGRALLLAAEDALRSAPCGEVSLWTEERNANARRIYQASGWRKTKELRERVWNGTAMRELRYRKRL